MPIPETARLESQENFGRAVPMRSRAQSVDGLCRLSDIFIPVVDDSDISCRVGSYHIEDHFDKALSESHNLWCFDWCRTVLHVNLFESIGEFVGCEVASVV